MTTQEVTFICSKNPELELVYRADSYGYTIDADGRQTVVSTKPEYIKFKQHLYTTSDPAKIEFIRNHGLFTGIGDIRKIEETLPPDPNQQKLLEYIKNFGYQNLVEAAEKQFGAQPGTVTTDPLAATAQATQQQNQQEYLYAQYQQGQMTPQQYQQNVVAMHQQQQQAVQPAQPVPQVKMMG